MDTTSTTSSSSTTSDDSDAGILEQLKALNETWCRNGGPKDDEKAKASGEAESDAGRQQVKDDPKTRKALLTPLQQARDAISKLPLPRTWLSERTTPNDGIVPHLFSALHKRGTEDGSKQLSQTPSPIDPDRSSTREYQLRQIEWHVVLLLELLCAYQSTRKQGWDSKSVFLDALVSAIRSYREQQSQQKIRKLEKKKRKRAKKRKKDDPLQRILSETEKAELLLGHLVDVLSRAPFLLPRDVPLSQFLTNRVLSNDTHFWERLPRIVSQIYENFEIPNPYLEKKKQKKRSLLLGSTVLDPKAHADSIAKTGKQKDAEREEAAKKRKTEKLQAIAKNKKRQRLASLASKKKHRGSHFHRNLDDISKLLDKTKSKSALPSNTTTRGVMKLATSDKAVSVKEERKLAHKKLTRTKVGRQETNKSHNKRGEARSKRPLQPNGTRRQTNIDDLLADPPATSTKHQSGVNNNPTSRSNSKNTTTEALPMTPRRTVQSDATSRVIGETPVPTSSGKRIQTVVGETPVLGDRCRSLQTIVGETPTYESGFGSTPRKNCAPFFSPPALPSPVRLPTPSAEETTKQPVKLFGLLKRTNSLGSRGRLTNKNAAVEGPRGDKRKLPSTSSIDKARAFLRSKSL